MTTEPLRLADVRKRGLRYRILVRRIVTALQEREAEAELYSHCVLCGKTDCHNFQRRDLPFNMQNEDVVRR